MNKKRKFLKILICSVLISLLISSFSICSLAVTAPEPESNNYTDYDENLMSGKTSENGVESINEFGFGLKDVAVGSVEMAYLHLALYNATTNQYVDTEDFRIEDLNTYGHEFERPYHVFRISFKNYIPVAGDRFILRLIVRLADGFTVASDEMVHVRLSFMYDNSYWNKSDHENWLGYAVGELNDTWYYCNSYYWMEGFPFLNGTRYYHRFVYDYLPQNPGMNYSEYNLFVPIRVKSDLSEYPYFTFVVYDPIVEVGTAQDFKTYGSPDTSITDNYGSVEQEILGGTEAGQAAAADIFGGTSGTLKNLSQSLSAVRLIYGDMLGALPDFNDLISISLSLGFFAFLLGATVSVFKSGNISGKKTREKTRERSPHPMDKWIDDNMRKWYG